MQLYDCLTHILEDARSKEREIRFIDGDKDESVLSFAALWDKAVNMLGDLQKRGMGPGDELIIFTRSNEKFVIAFWAALLGGIVPVPVAVGISDEHRFKLFRIISQMRHGTLFTEAELLDRLKDFAKSLALTDIQDKLDSASLTYRSIDPQLVGTVEKPDPEKTAFIQYSSGSTSDPKGVCLTHHNLTTNIRAIVEGLDWHADDQSLSWMPLTHDMGLIGYHLSVLAAGMNHAVMDTGVFVRRPLLWLSKASELKATQLCSPNFGYKHFLKLFERKGLDNLDLSSVRLILNGAEPISWELCEAFLGALAPFGLKRSTMFPVYGLAEATVAVTVSKPGSEISRITVDRHKLRIGEPYEVTSEGDADAVSFIKVGTAVRDCNIRITDDQDILLADGIVGHVQVQGASVTKGLYDNDEAEAELFTDDQWLRTGDCGVIVDDDLVITGRSKDIIIVNGQNYYPHDIEEIIARLDDLDLGKVVVAGVSSSASQSEEMLVFVLYRQDIESFREFADRVRVIVGEQTGLEVDHVIPVNRIPKTTSGKVQRSHLANAYLEGEFDEAVAALKSEIDESAGELDADPLVREIELICNEFSKERKIGPDDNLFEVGVSSLTLTEIVLAVEEKHPGKVDISDLFDYPTIRELADFIRR
jgi:acyl-CoA synthetase (AMP-forming)/AMP-acid ligase II/acyl carrier protein